MLVTALREKRLLGFLIDRVVARALLDLLPLQPGDNRVDLAIEIGAFLGRSGYDQRGSCFIDQDRVYFVDDGKV